MVLIPRTIEGWIDNLKYYWIDCDAGLHLYANDNYDKFEHIMFVRLIILWAIINVQLQITTIRITGSLRKKENEKLMVCGLLTPDINWLKLIAAYISRLKRYATQLTY